MTIYELTKYTKETRNRKEIVEGCTLDDCNPEIIEKFTDSDEALKRLSEMPKSKAEAFSSCGMTFYMVTEYAVEAYEADEDGDFVSGSDYYTNGEIEIID